MINSNEKPTYRALEIELEEARDQVLSLYRHEVDAIIGDEDVALVRTREIEKKLEEARRQLEQQYTGQSEELKKVKEELIEVLNKNEEMVESLKDRELELKNKSEEIKTLFSDLANAEERERRRLASILHDDIQQLMAGAKLHVGLMSAYVDDDGREQLETIKSILQETIDKTRNLSHELNPPILVQQGLFSALGWLADNMNNLHNLKTKCDFQTGKEPKDSQISGFVFRTVKEMLFNVKKHAGTDQAIIEIRNENGFLVIAVIDHGRGFDVSKVMEKRKVGLGILQIQKRARTIGGGLEVESILGQGSCFRLKVPI